MKTEAVPFRKAARVAMAVAVVAAASCGGRHKEDTLPAWDQSTPAPGLAGTGIGADEMGNMVDEAGEFHVKILRSYEDDEEGKLLLVAETHQPPAQDVKAAAAAVAGGKATAAALEAGGPAWWYATFDGIRIPWAVTSDAIAYYVGVIDAFRAGDFGPSAGVEMQKAALTYEAEVKRVTHFEAGGKSFDDVYVARLTLGWSQYCGPECAMAFFKERLVVMDHEGNVLAVVGDGKTNYIVS